MSCNTCGQINRGPAGPAGPTSANVVFSQSDLPSPSGGVITLAANTAYWIADTVVIDDGVAVQMQAGTCLRGNGKYCSLLVGNIDGAAFLRGPASNDMNIEDLGVLNNGTGTVISHDGGGVADAHLINVFVDADGVTDPGVVLTAEDEADLHNVDIINALIGLSLAGATGQVMVDDGLFAPGATGIQVLAAATVDRLRIGNTRFLSTTVSVDILGTVTDLQVVGDSFDLVSAVGVNIGAAGTVTALLLDASSFQVDATSNAVDNNGTVTDATVTGNTFSGAGTYFAGGAGPAQDGWLLKDNVGQLDTSFIGEISLYVASTGISAGAGDLGADAAVFAAIVVDRANNFALGGATADLTYTGNKDIDVKITAEICGAITAGAAIRILRILLNGGAVGRAAEVTLGGTGVPTQLVVSYSTTLSPGDVVSATINAGITELSSYHLSVIASA